MDANAYSKRTDKVIAILEADARLYEDMGGAQITIRKGVPDERLFTSSGHYIFVHWENTSTVELRGWSGGAKSDHTLLVKVWYVINDYSSEPAAEARFEKLAVNIYRILADNPQVANHWINMQATSGGSTILQPAVDAFWRVGAWNVRMFFTESV